MFGAWTAAVKSIRSAMANNINCLIVEWFNGLMD
jgi:hypothetical protein